jgi:hypothetical protein
MNYFHTILLLKVNGIGFGQCEYINQMITLPNDRINLPILYLYLNCK